MQKDDAVSLKDAHLSLDGNIAGTSLHGTLQLTHTETGDILLSPIAQAQLLDYLYHQRSILYRLTTLDLEGAEAPDWIRSDPHFTQWLVESTLAEPNTSPEGSEEKEAHDTFW